jgi:class 3 adenylate cyclase/tetratricopeptide (TPR) repeat protein
VTCPSCETVNGDGAKFCVECGTPLKLACPSCGAAHASGQRFCAECGNALAAGAATAAAPLSAAPATGDSEPAASAIAGELRVVSVLFLDLVGYTSLSESRDAEDVRALLSRYFDTARTIVGRHGGSIEKFIGDAVMAVWGVPVAHENDAERAVRAALELVDAVAVFGEEVGARALRARAGVVTGRAAAIDSTGEGLVVGDRVNTASRVQTIAEPGTVLVDDVTHGATAAAISYTEAGLHSVKGKEEPLQLWQAERVVAQIGGSQRQEGFEGALVGRDSELRLLKELLHTAADRRTARLVAITGPAGVGKTRLRWEVENYVDGLATDFLWHQGRCLSYGDGVAYWSIAEMVRQRLGIPQDAAPEEMADKLTIGLERWIPDRADREFLHSRLGALLGVSDPGLGRDELFAGWRLFFERLAEQSPVVLIFEDLQWADDGVLTFMEHLLDWSAQHPIFMLTLSRPELTARPDGWPATHHGATVLQLDPLPDAALHGLLDGLVGGLPAEARSRIVSRAEGIPLYAIETLRALADRGVLVADADGTWVVGGAVEDLDVPASLSSLLAARLDALTPEEREVVKAMAVFGGAFPRDTAAALSDVPADEIDAILTALVRKQFLIIRTDPLSPDRGQYGFAQQLLRTVAYEMLSRAELKPRHRRAAEHLRQAFPQDGEEVAEVVASHYLDAYRAAPDDPEADELRREALNASRRAARRAATVGAPGIAEKAYRTALELVGEDEDERITLMEAAGRAATSAGHYEAALELLEAAAAAHADAGRPRDAARIATAIAEALKLLGRVEDSVECIRTALEAMGAEDLDPDVALMNAELGGSLVFLGRADEARVPLERALAAAEALELWDVLCSALNGEGIRLDFAGRHEQAAGLFRTAVAVRTRTNRSSERELGNLAESLVNLGDPESVAACETALAEARRAGDARMECMTAGNLLETWLQSGRWERMHEFGGELLETYEEDSPDVSFARVRLATLHAYQGDPVAARAQLELASHLNQSDDIDDRGLEWAATATVELADGRLEAGLERALATVDAGIDALGADHASVRQSWPAAFDAALASGKVDVAAELVDRMAVLPPGRVPPLLKAELRRTQGLLAMRRGETERVEPALTDAIAALDALGYPFWSARARTDLAAWLIDQGRSTEAAPLLDTAIAALMNLGAAPALARARELAAQGAAVA